MLQYVASRYSSLCPVVCNANGCDLTLGNRLHLGHQVTQKITLMQSLTVRWEIKCERQGAVQHCNELLDDEQRALLEAGQQRTPFGRDVLERPG